MTLILPLITLGFAAGILAACLTAVPFWLSAAASCLLLAAGAAWQKRPLRSTSLLILAAGSLGLFAGGVAIQPPAAACFVGRHTSARTVRLSATVTTEVERLPDGQRQLLQARAMSERGRAVPLCGLVELYRPAAAPPLAAGERVMLRTRLRPVRGGLTYRPGRSGLRHHALGVGAVAYQQDEELLIVGQRRRGWLSAARASIYQAIGQAIPDGDCRAVVAALVVGERSGLSAELRQRLSRAGVSHLVAVSGLHLSLVTLVVAWCLRRTLLHLPGLGSLIDARRFSAPLAAVAAIGYTLLVGAPPSAVRACVMVCCCLGGLLVDRAPDLVRPLALAALLLLSWEPLNVLRPSFQLSFAAVLALVFLHQRQQRQPQVVPTRQLRRRILRLFWASAVVTLATAPLTAHHFQQVAWLGVLSNLLAIPLTTFGILPLGMMGAVTAELWPAVSQLLLGAAGQLTALLLTCCAAVAAWSWSAWEVAISGTVAASLLLVALALLARGGLRRGMLLVGLVLLLVAGLPWLWRQLDPALTVTILDVGQGDSILAQLPEGQTLLVDGGGSIRGSYDPGAARVVPALRAAGVRRIDYLVASHPHPDHVGGLGAVMEAFEVGELWSCWHGERDPWQEELLRRARAQGIPIRAPRRLQLGAVTVDPRWPTGYGPFCADPAYQANDNSIVLLLRYGRAGVLLPGDVERAAEQQLASAISQDLSVSLLKVPHHGSRSSASEALLRAARPRLAVISCGLQNSFGFPHPEVLQRLKSHRIPVLRTDQLGTITVRLYASGQLRCEGQGDCSQPAQ